jgi:hypothetical protein
MPYREHTEGDDQHLTNWRRPRRPGFDAGPGISYPSPQIPVLTPAQEKRLFELLAQRGINLGRGSIARNLPDRLFTHLLNRHGHPERFGLSDYAAADPIRNNINKGIGITGGFHERLSCSPCCAGTMM